MDLSKLKGTQGKTGNSSPSDNGADKKGPKNITETKAFKDASGGIGNMWANYKYVLASNFKRMNRTEQEQLIVRMCQVITVGCAIVLTTFFYQFVPLLIRVFALPAFIVGSWFVATRVVSPIIIAQFENKLNQE